MGVDLAAAWAGLARASGLRDASGLGDVSGLGDRLIAAWSEGHRRYHGPAHLAWLLAEIDRRAALVGDADFLRLAAWFHDAIYDPLAKDNEARSAMWAAKELPAHGLARDRAEAVAALVRKTAAHHSADATMDEALFLDMDFAILGAPREVYVRYADDVRAEYAAVPDAAFRTGRMTFLRNTLSAPRLFRTDLYERELAAAARANIAWELGRLDA